MKPALDLVDVSKTFTLHLQGGLAIQAVADVSFRVHAGECVALAGPSGAGKSSILRMIYGNYRCDRGQILVRCGGVATDVARAEPRRILDLRRTAIGYVSQFLRAIPRVAAVDIVAEPATLQGGDPADAQAAASRLLRRLNIADRLLRIPPATFSGGEQQRVNIARGFLSDLPILLLDEPTASLDAANRAVVIELIAEKKRQGKAIVAVVHDDDVRAAIADAVIDITSRSLRAA